MDLGFETIGNATIICHDKGPILATDPWIQGPAYFGSWTLSHPIPAEQRESIEACPFVWISHGHPDHLSAESLETLREARILLPDHLGGRIRKELGELGFIVQILPDRRWIRLSPRIRVMSIPDYNQDAILLVDLGGRLLVNLNDAGDRGWGRFVRQEIEKFPVSFLLALSGFGDADMINFHTESGERIPPAASLRIPVGQGIARRAELFGARYFVPFSSMHRYQRADSVWANQYTTALGDYQEGFSSSTCELLPAFVRLDFSKDDVQQIHPPAAEETVVAAEDFGDKWEEELTRKEAMEVESYFRRVEHLRTSMRFLNLRVGGKDNLIDLDGRGKERGITFEVPRGSLLTAIRYRVFDDLLIGNFMKTTLHGSWEKGRLYPDFSPYVAKYGDNGGVYSQREISRYLEQYRARDPVGYVLHLLESRWVRPVQENTANLLRERLGEKSELFRLTKRAFWGVRKGV